MLSGELFVFSVSFPVVTLDLCSAVRGVRAHELALVTAFVLIFVTASFARAAFVAAASAAVTRAFILVTFALVQLQVSAAGM